MADTLTTDDTTTTDANTPATDEPAKKRRTVPLSDRARRDRLAANPNPQAMDITALLNAIKDEAGASRGAWRSDAWSYAHMMTVASSDGGRAWPIVTEFKQWDPSIKDYSEWMRNPRLKDVTEVPIGVVFDVFKRMIRDHRAESTKTSVDNICTAVGVTYAPTHRTFKLNFDVTITDDMIQAAGYTPSNVSSDTTDRYTKEYLYYALREYMRDNWRNLNYTVDTTTVAPAVTD